MEMNENRSSTVPTIAGVIIAILVCCACLTILAAAGLFFFSVNTVVEASDLTPFSPSVTQDFETPPPTIELTRPPIESVPADTLQTLENSEVPENDPYELACRLEAKCNVPRTLPSPDYQVGDRETFWIVDSDTGRHTQYDFTLLYETPHSYFWAQAGVQANINEVKALMDTFENEIYPTTREFFGSEFTPGVDDDPHIYVLYASELGTNVGGYFNSSDSFHPEVNEYSNAHETYVLSTSTPLGNDYAYGTLAHEFVHMIQFATDRNDSTWISEGFADVGSLINGYGQGGSDWEYVLDPDLQLNSWADNTSPDFSRHYGQSFLYLAYFLDRFGEAATQAVTANPENDLQSIDDTLAQLNLTDPLTGQVITADDLFMDWAATLYLQDGNVGDGRYTYKLYPNAPQYTPSEFISDCPQTLNGTVNQYGIDYLTLTCPGEHTLSFSGSTVTGLLPVNAYSGNFAFWSNMGNESNMTLTREFDFTGVTGPISLDYRTWYDIEQDWDYAYLSASINGQTWEILQAPSSTNYDPTGQSFGWAFTGQTNGWVEESVDLSQYAGQKVQVRFEYVTDAAVNGEGFLLDDVRVDALNYSSDFEADDGGWVAEGFARVENVLPQTYRLSLMVMGDTTTVTPIELNADQTAEIPLSLQPGDQAVLIVTGTTRFTRIPAPYLVEVR